MKRVLTAAAYTGCCLVVPSGQALSSVGPVGGASAGGGGGWRPLSAPNPQGSDSTAPATGYAVDGDGVSGNPDESYYAPPPSNTYNGQQFGTEATMGAEQQQQQQQRRRRQQQGLGLNGDRGYYKPPPDYQQLQPPPSREYQQPNPYLPRQSRWTGQNRAESPLSQQQYGHDNRSQRPYQPEPFRRWTKWRSIVSRVKDTVRPGQPMGYEQGKYYQGGGAWGDGDDGNGFSGYPASAPSWGYQQGAAPHNSGASATAADGGYEQQRTGGGGYTDSYRLEQQQGEAALEGYERQQGQAHSGRYPPPTFSGGSSAGVIEQGDDRVMGGDDGRRLQPSSPPDLFYNPGGSDDDLYGAERAVNGGGGSHGYGDFNIAAVGSGIAGGTTVVQEEREGPAPEMMAHGVASSSHPAPQDQHAIQHQPEGSYGEQTVGQGWAPATPEPAYAAPHPLQRKGSEDHNDVVEGGERAPLAAIPVPASSSSPPLHAQSQAVGRNDTARGHAECEDGGAAAAAAVEAADYALPSSPPKYEGLAESTSLSSGVEAAHPASIGNSNDPMPSSADHGLQKVDWGKGVEEDDGILSDLTAAGITLGEEEQREEEALIRELERMDGIGGGELDAVAPPVDELLMEEVQDADEAMEHTLDVLFESIREDESNNNGCRNDLDVGVDDRDDSVAPVTPADELVAPAAEHGFANNGLPAASAVSNLDTDQIGTEHVEEHVAVKGGNAATGDDRHPEQQQQKQQHQHQHQHQHQPQETWHEHASDSKSGSSSSQGLSGPANDENADNCGDVEEKLQESTATSDSGGSSWGQTSRWESLPAHAVVVHKPGGEEDFVDEVGREEEEEEEIDDEDSVDIFIPLDPIELPPSAASDEIWNDQHLQDQLDAYWEQSRRATGGGGGGGGGVGYASGLFPGAGANGGQIQQQQVQQQLSRLPGNLQPSYGPGDWVGKSASPGDWLSRSEERGVTEMMVQQEPLPGTVVDGVPRAGSNWLTPNLLQGNQAPINIYGNVHVHLPSGQQNGDQQYSPGSSELSARERYYSQGETSWSGSERGSQ